MTAGNADLTQVQFASHQNSFPSINKCKLGEILDAGCTLPVEMFFPSREFPTTALEVGLAQQGVVCRALPPLHPADLPPINATDTKTDLSGFTMKIAALILSRFQEVIHLLALFALTLKMHTQAVRILQDF